MYSNMNNIVQRFQRYSPLSQPPIQIHLSDDKKPQSARIHHSTCVSWVCKFKKQIFLDGNSYFFYSYIVCYQSGKQYQVIFFNVYQLTNWLEEIAMSATFPHPREKLS